MELLLNYKKKPHTEINFDYKKINQMNNSFIFKVDPNLIGSVMFSLGSFFSTNGIRNTEDTNNLFVEKKDRRKTDVKNNSENITRSSENVSYKKDVNAKTRRLKDTHFLNNDFLDYKSYMIDIYDDGTFIKRDYQKEMFDTDTEVELKNTDPIFRILEEYKGLKRDNRDMKILKQNIELIQGNYYIFINDFKSEVFIFNDTSEDLETPEIKIVEPLKSGVVNITKLLIADTEGYFDVIKKPIFSCDYANKTKDVLSNEILNGNKVLYQEMLINESYKLDKSKEHLIKNNIEILKEKYSFENILNVEAKHLYKSEQYYSLFDYETVQREKYKKTNLNKQIKFSEHAAKTTYLNKSYITNRKLNNDVSIEGSEGIEQKDKRITNYNDNVILSDSITEDIIIEKFSLLKGYNLDAILFKNIQLVNSNLNNLKYAENIQINRPSRREITENKISVLNFGKENKELTMQKMSYLNRVNLDEMSLIKGYKLKRINNDSLGYFNIVSGDKKNNKKLSRLSYRSLNKTYMNDLDVSYIKSVQKLKKYNLLKLKITSANKVSYNDVFLKNASSIEKKYNDNLIKESAKSLVRQYNEKLEIVNGNQLSKKYNNDTFLIKEAETERLYQQNILVQKIKSLDNQKVKYTNVIDAFNLERTKQGDTNVIDAFNLKRLSQGNFNVIEAKSIGKYYKANIQISDYESLNKKYNRNINYIEIKQAKKRYMDNINISKNYSAYRGDGNKLFKLKVLSAELKRKPTINIMNSNFVERNNKDFKILKTLSAEQLRKNSIELIKDLQAEQLYKSLISLNKDLFTNPLGGRKIKLETIESISKRNTEISIVKTYAAEQLYNNILNIYTDNGSAFKIPDYDIDPNRKNLFFNVKNKSMEMLTIDSFDVINKNMTLFKKIKSGNKEKAKIFRNLEEIFASSNNKSMSIDFSSTRLEKLGDTLEVYKNFKPIDFKEQLDLFTKDKEYYLSKDNKIINIYKERFITKDNNKNLKLYKKLKTAWKDNKDAAYIYNERMLDHKVERNFILNKSINAYERDKLDITIDNKNIIYDKYKKKLHFSNHLTSFHKSINKDIYLSEVYKWLKKEFVNLNAVDNTVDLSKANYDFGLLNAKFVGKRMINKQFEIDEIVSIDFKEVSNLRQIEKQLTYEGFDKEFSLYHDKSFDISQPIKSLYIENEMKSFEMDFKDLNNIEEFEMIKMTLEKKDINIKEFKDIITNKKYKDMILNVETFVENRTPDKYNEFFRNVTDDGFDELLLPKSDYDYSKHLEDILDENGEPIDPLKETEDGHFIAKMPINHPLENIHETLQKDFLLVDVSIMKYMIEATYYIWKKNIFVFGATDMKSAINDMLDRLDKLIMFKIPPKLKPQANRVLRLIRWYAEAAIINNSEYKIIREYAESKSSMTNGQFNLDHEKTNLYVDTELYMLTLSNSLQDAELILNVNNKKDGKVTFSYQMKNGTMSIQVNDEISSTYNNNGGEIEKFIEKGSNVIKIRFINNESGAVFRIANVITPYTKFIKAETEYVADLSKGNLVIDEMLKKASIYTNVLEDSAEFVDELIEGNIAIGDLIDRLITYYDKHHLGKKSKGKRKTIRK